MRKIKETCGRCKGQFRTSPGRWSSSESVPRTRVGDQEAAMADLSMESSKDFRLWGADRPRLGSPVKFSSDYFLLPLIPVYLSEWQPRRAPEQLRQHRLPRWHWPRHQLREQRQRQRGKTAESGAEQTEDFGGIWAGGGRGEGEGAGGWQEGPRIWLRVWCERRPEWEIINSILPEFSRARALYINIVFPTQKCNLTAWPLIINFSEPARMSSFTAAQSKSIPMKTRMKMKLERIRSIGSEKSKSETIPTSGG